MLISNCSNDTMLGKVFLVEPEKIDIKLYDNMKIIDSDDQVIYNKTADPSNLMMEGLSENNPLAFGETYLNLPSCTSLLDQLEDNLESFLEE